MPLNSYDFYNICEFNNKIFSVIWRENNYYAATIFCRSYSDWLRICPIRQKFIHSSAKFFGQVAMLKNFYPSLVMLPRNKQLYILQNHIGIYESTEYESKKLI